MSIPPANNTFNNYEARQVNLSQQGSPMKREEKLRGSMLSPGKLDRSVAHQTTVEPSFCKKYWWIFVIIVAVILIAFLVLLLTGVFKKSSTTVIQNQTQANKVNSGAKPSLSGSERVIKR